MNVFFGEVPLCYTNSVAMTLSSYGYDFHPEYLEAIMAMGNGANFVNNDQAHPIVFFDNGEPDISISNCLRILGFEYEEFFLTAPDEVNVNMIKEKLKFYLKNGSIIAGPLDMGYLTYNPNHVNLKGIDHFVAIYDLVENDIYLHDPAGYPCMRMDLNEFLQAWKAENIYYKRGSFSMWGNLERTITILQKTPFVKDFLFANPRRRFFHTHDCRRQTLHTTRPAPACAARGSSRPAC